MKTVISLILFCSSLSVVAQDDYVITTKNDSIVGKIVIPLPAVPYEEILVKGDSKQRLKSYEIVRFMAKGKMYETVKLGDQYKLMLLKSRGYMSIYAFRIKTSEFGTLCLKKATGEVMEVPNIKFRKSVANFISECPSLSESVLSKEFKRNNLDQLLTEYNACIASGEAYKTLLLQKQSPDSTLKLAKQLSKNISKTDGDIAEIKSIISDIISKLKRDEDIPDYLRTALQEESSKFPKLEQEITTLIDQLK